MKGTDLNGKLQDCVSFAARLLIAAIFIWSGAGKILHFAATLTHMRSYGLPLREVLAIAAIVIELGSGLAIALGWRTRWMAMAVLLFMIPVTLIFHYPGAGQGALIQFMKNLSIMGGLLMLVAYGPGRFSLDRK